jgi:NADPH:quinone reductase-like Zn-dependent oxidoreductase
MKAVIINQYGSASVLQYTDIEKPQIKPDQLLVKVHATSVNPIDWKIRSGHMSLLTGKKFPMVLGFDVSGEVVEVGDKVTRFKPGDQIYAYLDGLPGGAYAEYAAVSEKVACLKPNNMTYEQAAAVPLAALTALQAWRDLGQIKPGHHVLINGASGGVGSLAVQIAKAMDAHVTAVCSTKNIEFVKSLGADRIIDYTISDFTKDTSVYDIIFDTVAKQSFSRCQSILKPNGVYITTLPAPENLLQGLIRSILPGKKAKTMLSKASGTDLVYIKELIEADKIRAVIDKTYPLSELPAAHTYSEQGRAVGKIAIAVAS